MSENDAADWVFAYGSLMWRPGFAPAERSLARLEGYERRFCLTSIAHRGTPERPGLVLALDRGAFCDGVAFRFPSEGRDDVLAALRERELVTYAYHERLLPVRLADGRAVQALAYVIDPTHWQYRGGLSRDDMAETILHAEGKSGRNSDYLFNTAAHLAELGLPDPEMEALAEEVRARLARNCTSV